MITSSLKFNSSEQGVCFKGAKTPNIDDLRAAKRFANCGMDLLEEKLLKSVKSKAPEVVQTIDECSYIPPDSLGRKVTTSIKAFFGLPLDALNAVAEKFPNSPLYNSKFLRKHREAAELDAEIKAIQGIHSKALDYVKECMPEGEAYPTGGCTPRCAEICKPIKNKFHKALNNAMGDDVANYDTKKERVATRLVSGFTAAMFLGNDFYNNAIKKGKTDEEAKKAQHLKQGQEVKENICEAITQFAVFSCFSKFVNSNVWAPALLSTAIGLVSRVISRVSSNMPITRIKVPPKPQVPSMMEFTSCAKTKTMDKIAEKHQEKEKEKEAKPLINKKGPVLSGKNIALICLASIAAGYSMRFLKNHTEIGKKIAQKLQEHQDKFDAKTIETVYADKKTLDKISKVLKTSNNGSLGAQFSSCKDKIKPGENKIAIGTRYKTTNLFGLVDVKTKDLYALRTAPFRFVKELVSFPYKIATKLETAIKNSKLISNNTPPPPEPKVLKDDYNIRNIYERFREFENKYGDDDAKLADEFGKYVKKMYMTANNEVTSSKSDNSKIAVIAQTLGTITGMWFSMNDEFNAAVRNGSTKEEAEKDARLRGINKFFRMTVQLIISGSLNDIFAKQYNNSIASSALIVAASTIATDAASRVLTGMPTKKMGSKEQLEAYQKHHKEGVMAGYYKLIDKLAS